MAIKFFPRTYWKVSSQFRKEYLIQKVEDSIMSKSWRSSLVSASNNYNLTCKVLPDGFSINLNGYGEKSGRRPFRSPLKVRANKVEHGDTILDCRLGFSDGDTFLIILFYLFFIFLSFQMGFKKNDWLGGLIPLAIALCHYVMILFSFNRQLIVYKRYINKLAGK